ncbi:hypothetical protein Fot_32940 [Forsythia ovata]|uniref:Uncharacterized protein n=1 Tax=Forsythia ovata TaxID=205694 RepID=A0ABD1T976_9LAMI
MLQKQEVRAKLVEKIGEPKKRIEARSTPYTSIVIGVGVDDLIVLKEEGFTRKNKKPRTTYSKSPQNLPVGSDETSDISEVVDPSKLESGSYNNSVHIKKDMEGRPTEIDLPVLCMFPNHLQPAVVSVDSFWTEGWAKYSTKLPLKPS